MKRVFVASLLFFCFSFNTFAVEAVFKMAAIDFNNILENLPSHKDALSKIEKRAQDLSVELMKERDSIEAKYKDLESRSHILSKEAVQAARETLEKEHSDFQQKMNGANSMINSAHYDVRNVIMTKTTEACADIAREEGYSVVVHLSTLVYVDKSIDITEKVLKKLVTGLKNIPVVFKDADNLAKTSSPNAAKKIERKS
ncbi:OmpH family outer membrane protein [Candidatus Cyrtobacter comes]|uniref:OmpH family outer membrane protein n=1 Tax=Candidatus Cyrtobacter comes TaxID=675776 RepID=A0ABU5L8V6_9RICK|nr:OmpH family outer membrane protein [Candidatus Cyrtobacter comes]MDZ5762552.1 OmpH family outer membrane protein [Candidatus Cyrtobacter comes]